MFAYCFNHGEMFQKGERNLQYSVEAEIQDVWCKTYINDIFKYIINTYIII